MGIKTVISINSTEKTECPNLKRWTLPLSPYRKIFCIHQMEKLTKNGSEIEMQELKLYIFYNKTIKMRLWIRQKLLRYDTKSMIN